MNSAKLQDTRYKCNIIFKPINNNNSKNKMKKMTQFPVTSIRIKFFGTNLTLDLRLMY